MSGNGTGKTQVLRSTMYGPNLEPVSMVAREQDMTEPLEQVQEALLEVGPGNDAAGLIVFDLFTMQGEPDILEATLVATERQAQRHERERNMAMLYYFDAAQFSLVSDGGTLTATQPAPLSVDEICSTLKQLVKHPHYRDHLIVAISEDLQIITIRGDELRVGGVDDITGRT
jgi:hypothetical protein